MFADGGVRFRFLFDKNKANFLTYISNLSQKRTLHDDNGSNLDRILTCMGYFVSLQMTPFKESKRASLKITWKFLVRHIVKFLLVIFQEFFGSEIFRTIVNIALKWTSRVMNYDMTP